MYLQLQNENFHGGSKVEQQFFSISVDAIDCTSLDITISIWAKDKRQKTIENES